MNMDMPRQRLPHLSLERTRHGRLVWYVRVGKGPRIRLRAAYGTPEFNAEYQAAVEGRPLQANARAAKGTLQWLVDQHRGTTAWAQLSLSTRREREKVLRHILAKSGHERISAINRASIVAGIEARTPAAGAHFLAAMRGLFSWAERAGHVAHDPTAGIKTPRASKPAGIAPWSEDDVTAYEERWALGTRERVWLDVLLYTGLRRGDAVRIGRQHIRDGVAALATEKTGQVVTIPILPILQRTLDAGPCSDLAFIASSTGQPFRKQAFGNAFAKACRAARLRKRSPHGLRKIAATRAAENGATVAQLEAIFGWSGGGMASLYTRSADRVRLAREAIGKLAKANEDRTKAPAPPSAGAGQMAKNLHKSI